MANLKLKRHDNGHSEYFALKKERTIIGRSHPSDIRFPTVQNLSRQHAEITLMSDVAILRDLNSKNGTYVNGVKISSHFLNHGDMIKVGDVIIEFHSLTFSIPGETQIFKPTDLDRYGPATPEETAKDISAFRLLYRITREMIVVRSPQELILLTIDLVKRFLLARDVYVYLLENENTFKQIQAGGKSRKIRENETGEVISWTLLQKVLDEKIAIAAENTAEDPHLKEAESIISKGINSIMAAPMIVDNRLLGVIVADFSSPVAHFNKNHIELLSAVANLFAVNLEQNRLMDTIEKENSIRQRLAQFHSKAVVDEIIRQGGGLEPEEHEVSVWFCDVSGFTAYAENNSPYDVQKLINQFFEMAVYHIFEYAGTLDKYLGDGFMAVFGAPFARKDDAVRAIHCAIALHRDIQIRNQTNSTNHPIEIRSGIATGRVIAGDIGAEIRKDYTVLGDTVNIAMRLQQEVAKKNEIVIDISTVDKIRNSIPVSEIGEKVLRGREKPINAFRVCPPKLQNLK